MSWIFHLLLIYPFLISSSTLSEDKDFWSPMPAPPTARTEASIAIVGDKIYVIGGFTPKGVSAKVEMFDLVKKVWSERKPLPQAPHHNRNFPLCFQS